VKNSRIIRIDVILLRGVVESLLESSIVASLLKFLILVRDKSEKLSVMRVY
jgi:energy-converting hydrogenase Eha subunit A